MNVSCPQCKTVFRVDPSKVPVDGVRARCSVCGGVFEVASQEDQSELAAVAAATVPEPAVVESVATAPEAIPEPVEEAIKVEVEPPEGLKPAEEPSIAPPHVVPVVSEPAAPAPAEREEPESAPRSPFGAPDQDARARRLARALISDLAAYHPERQQKGLKEGRLKELFQDDLRKSWQEYVDQVGLDVAKSTPYFRDALNDILAKGKRVF